MYIRSLFISIRGTTLAAMFPQANRQHNIILLLNIIPLRIIRIKKFKLYKFTAAKLIKI